MPYCDNFLAYRCTREYPIACLFDSLCKIVNWEPAYQICYCLLSSRQQCKTWNSCATWDPDFVIQDLWPPNSPGLNTVYYRICGVLHNVFIGNLLKLNADELKWLLIEVWFGIQQSVADQAIDQWRGHLSACIKATGRILKTRYDVLFHNSQ